LKRNLSAEAEAAAAGPEVIKRRKRRRDCRAGCEGNCAKGKSHSKRKRAEEVSDFGSLRLRSGQVVGFGFSINRIWKKKLHKFVWLPVSEILAASTNKRGITSVSSSSIVCGTVWIDMGKVWQWGAISAKCGE